MYEKKGISVACGTIELSLRCALFSHSGQGYASLALFIWFSIKTVGLFSPSIIEEDVVDTPRGLLSGPKCISVSCKQSNTALPVWLHLRVASGRKSISTE